MLIACVRDEIQVVTLTGVESHSMLSTHALVLSPPKNG